LKTVDGVAVFWGRFAAEEGANAEAWAVQEAKARKLFQLAEKYSSLDSIPAEARAELNLTFAEGGANASSAGKNVR
jgi:hypothetical protein